MPGFLKLDASLSVERNTLESLTKGDFARRRLIRNLLSLFVRFFENPLFQFFDVSSFLLGNALKRLGLLNSSRLLQFRTLLGQLLTLHANHIKHLGIAFPNKISC